MKSSNKIKQLGLGYIFISIISFFLLLFLESEHLVDSLGLWYTVYSATTLSALILISLIFIYFVFNQIHKRGRKT